MPLGACRVENKEDLTDSQRTYRYLADLFKGAENPDTFKILDAYEIDVRKTADAVYSVGSASAEYFDFPSYFEGKNAKYKQCTESALDELICAVSPSAQCSDFWFCFHFISGA